MGIYRQLLAENVDYSDDNLFMEMTFTDPKIDKKFALSRSQLMNLVEFYKDYNVNQYVLSEALANKKKAIFIADLEIRLGIDCKKLEKSIQKYFIPVFKESYKSFDPKYAYPGQKEYYDSKAKKFDYFIKDFRQILGWIDLLDLKFKIFGNKEIDMNKFTKAVELTFLAAVMNDLMEICLGLIFGPDAARYLVIILVAPYVEEFCKQVATDQGFGDIFAQVFNFIETGFIYIPRMISLGYPLPVAIGLRMAPIAMHQINQIVHNMSRDPEIMKALKLTNSKQDQERLQYIAQVVTYTIHSVWNVLALVIENTLLK